jgi:hypothetical protein
MDDQAQANEAGFREQSQSYIDGDDPVLVQQVESDTTSVGVQYGSHQKVIGVDGQAAQHDEGCPPELLSVEKGRYQNGHAQVQHHVDEKRQRHTAEYWQSM